MNSSLVEIFSSFLPENYSIITRKNHKGEIIYWAIRYRKTPTESTVNSVVAGTIMVSSNKLFVYSRNSENPNLESIREGLNKAFSHFGSKFPDFAGKYEIS